MNNFLAYLKVAIKMRPLNFSIDKEGWFAMLKADK